MVAEGGEFAFFIFSKPVPVLGPKQRNGIILWANLERQLLTRTGPPHVASGPCHAWAWNLPPNFLIAQPTNYVHTTTKKKRNRKNVCIFRDPLTSFRISWACFDSDDGWLSLVWWHLQHIVPWPPSSQQQQQHNRINGYRTRQISWKWWWNRQIQAEKALMWRPSIPLAVWIVASRLQKLWAE